MSFADRYPDDELTYKETRMNKLTKIRNKFKDPAMFYKIPNKDAIWTIKKALIIEVLDRHEWHIHLTAKQLGVSYKTLKNYIDKMYRELLQ